MPSGLLFTVLSIVHGPPFLVHIDFCVLLIMERCYQPAFVNSVIQDFG